jgi:ribosomal-protein-alanine N-acetyltransferase
MTLNDIDQVVELDRLSFPIAWSARTYQHEIVHNDSSTMVVIQEADAAPVHKGNGGEQAGWLPRLLIPERRPYVPLLGYAGFWTIADEAHISTIAVHPDWRGHKLGELQIWFMVQEAIRKGAGVVTLEVRVGNQVAINLYRKYGFTIVGRRKGYYRDNGEDAHIMALTPLDAALQARLERFKRTLSRTLIIELGSLTR